MDSWLTSLFIFSNAFRQDQICSTNNDPPDTDRSQALWRMLRVPCLPMAGFLLALDTLHQSGTIMMAGVRNLWYFNLNSPLLRDWCGVSRGNVQLRYKNARQNLWHALSLGAHFRQSVEKQAAPDTSIWWSKAGYPSVHPKIASSWMFILQNIPKHGVRVITRFASSTPLKLKAPFLMLIWGFPEMGVPKWVVYQGRIPFEWVIWGYSHFRKPPYD